MGKQGGGIWERPNTYLQVNRPQVRNNRALREVLQLAVFPKKPLNRTGDVSRIFRLVQFHGFQRDLSGGKLLREFQLARG